MRFSLKIKGLDSEVVRLDDASIEVEYEKDELLELIKLYPTLIEAVIQIAAKGEIDVRESL